MPYALGIDLGTARTVAAVSRNRRDGWSEPVAVPLDATADRPGVASVLHFTGDDTVEVGDTTGGRPDRVARDFLDRVGDEVPLALGGQHYPAESLAAALVAWVVDRAEALEGTAATQLVVTHPVGWGAHRRAAFQTALRELSLPELTMLPRPVAAAEAYAANERLEVGDEVAVYSLGAGRFEAAVLRRGSFGFELRSHADSTDVLGGNLFDDLLADHATTALGEVPPEALAAWRTACVAAKERLTQAVAVTIPAPPGAKKATISVNRTDFDTLIRPVVDHTVRILQRAIAAADASALRAVVLVGGCAHVPLIAELVSAAVRVRVVPADDPTTALARGAALAAGRVAKPTVQAPAVASVTQHTDLMRFDDLSPELPDIGPPPPRPPVELAPLDPPARGLARLTRRNRPTEEPEEKDTRDPVVDSDVVDLLTHTDDEDNLTHLRDESRRVSRRIHDNDDAADFADQAPSHPSFPPATRRPAPPADDAPARPKSHPSFPPAGRRTPSHPSFAPVGRQTEEAEARPTPGPEATPSHPGFAPAARGHHTPPRHEDGPLTHADQAPDPRGRGHTDPTASSPDLSPVGNHEPAGHPPAPSHDDRALRADHPAPNHERPRRSRHTDPAGHEPEADRPPRHNEPPRHPGITTGHHMPAPRHEDHTLRAAPGHTSPSRHTNAPDQPTGHHAPEPDRRSRHADPADHPPTGHHDRPTRHVDHEPANPGNRRSTRHATDPMHPGRPATDHEPAAHAPRHEGPTGHRYLAPRDEDMADPIGDPRPPRPTDHHEADLPPRYRDTPGNHEPMADQHNDTPLGHPATDRPSRHDVGHFETNHPPRHTSTPAGHHEPAADQHNDTPLSHPMADRSPRHTGPETDRPTRHDVGHPETNHPPRHTSTPAGHHEPAADQHNDTPLSHPETNRSPRHTGPETGRRARHTPVGHHEADHLESPRREIHAGPTGHHHHEDAHFPDPRTPAHHQDPPRRRRRADDEPRHAELPGPRTRANHSRHADGRHHDEPALAQRHRRRRRDDDGDA